MALRYECLYVILGYALFLVFSTMVTNFKFLPFLVLACTALVVTPQSARAVANTNWPPVPFSTPVTDNGATFTGDSVGGGAGTFTFDSPMANLWTTSLNFNPGYNSGGVSQEFKYTLSTSNGDTFTLAGLTSQMQALLPGGEFSKEVCSTGFGAGTCVNLSTIDTATSPNMPLVGFGSKIWVKDTYKTTNGTAQITGITNAFLATAATNNVPGPLPVLGAGAAFGFSRKLRKRIKQSA
jgi:hypothetical protein